MTRPPRRDRGTTAGAADASGDASSAAPGTPRPKRRVAGSRIRRPRGRAITPRSLVLGATIVFLVVILASPVARYVASRTAVNAAAQQLAQDQHSLATVRGQLQQWNSPDFVEQQARQRLQYAMPGETVYVVVRPGQQNQLDDTSGPGVHVRPPDLTWNQKLWVSVQAAAKTTP